MVADPSPAPKEAPRGVHPARVDDKGRLKLPVEIERFLKGERLFITSLDGRVGRIYPLPVWQKNEELLQNDLENPEWAEHVSLIADKYGADAEVDGQGRVLVPTLLRRKMGIENQPVYLRHYQGAIHIYSASLYEESEKSAEENIEEKIQVFRKKGLK